MRLYVATFLAAALVSGAGCGDDGDGGGDIDAPVPDAAIDAPIDAGTDGGFVQPTMLSETGLYSDIGTKTIATGVVEFLPRWQLWSDGAAKRRWIYLPPGSRIDTSDMDYWSFPVGTKVWKEFVRGGDRIETRLLQKIAEGDEVASWFMVSFQWDANETDAMALPSGFVDENGVNDIPDRSKCRQCHQPSRNKAVILGFQALQLDYDAPDDGLDLDYLVQNDWLTVEPTASGTGVYFPLPEETGTPVIEPALGYLHGNCGGCHNADSDVQNTVPLELRLSTTELGTWEATDTYRTAVNVAASLGNQGTHVVKGMDVAESAIHNRMMSVLGPQMPPIGREQVDTDALAAIDAWINSLPAPN